MIIYQHLVGCDEEIIFDELRQDGEALQVTIIEYQESQEHFKSKAD